MPSADRPEGADGRQYHIGVKKGEVGPFVILVGDPERARRCSERLQPVRVERTCREYVTFTGVHAGIEITLMATGMGCDNTEIALMELLACLDEPPVFIRVGSCGAVRPGVGIGDLVVSTGAHRLENTSLGFVEQGFPAVAHHEVVLALVTAAHRLGADFHTGITATASGFYGWQGREDQPIPPRDPDLPARLGRMGVTNLEMETSTLFTLSTLAGARAGAVCTVFANRVENTFIEAASKTGAEDRAFGVALEAIGILVRMDARAGGGPYTVPE